MRLKRLITFLVWLAAAFINAPYLFAQEEVSWPEPRPLGKEFKTFKAGETDSTTPQTEEPTGDIALRQALSLALMKNPELAAFSWEARAGEARTLQSGLLPNPELSVDAEYFGGSGSFRAFDRSETTVRLGQLVELAGKRLKRKRLAALERDLAGWDYEAKRLDVFTRTAMDFIDVLAAQERLAQLEELLRLSEETLRVVSERVKAGKVSPVMETKAGIGLAATRIEWERAKRNLESARKRLTAQWGGETPVFGKAEGELNAIAPIPSPDQLEQMVSQNPDMARWVLEMEQRKAAVDLADSGKIPDLTVSAGARRINETKDTAFVLGVSVPLPLFNQNQGTALEARHRLSKAREEQRAAEIRIKTALATACQDLAIAHSEATAWKTGVLPGAQSAFDAAREGYRHGKFSFMDVLDAQRTFFEAKGKYIETLAAYHKAVAAVERLIGSPLEAIIKEKANEK